MKRTFLAGIFTLSLAGSAQATMIFNEEFDGTGADYNFDSTTAMVGDNDWVDFSNRITVTAIGGGGEGFAIAAGGTESVLTGASSANDPQIRTDFQPGIDKSLVTDITLRLRIDSDQNNTYDDVLVGSDFTVFYGTSPYLNPGAGNAPDTNVNLGSPTSLVDEGNNGWHLATWTFASGLTGGAGTDVLSFRIDPTNTAAGNGDSFELDYLRVEIIPEPGTAILLSIGSLLVMAARRFRD